MVKKLATVAKIANAVVKRARSVHAVQMVKNAVMIVSVVAKKERNAPATIKSNLLYFLMLQRELLAFGMVFMRFHKRLLTC